MLDEQGQAWAQALEREPSHLQVEEHAAGDVLASTGLREKGVERVVASADCLVAWHLTIGLDA